MLIAFCVAITTELTQLFKIDHPVLLAGMNVAAGPKLAAAVTNAGGLGVIGGVGYSPEMLKEQIDELKSYLNDKNAPFGVDLLLPQVGGSARYAPPSPLPIPPQYTSPEDRVIDFWIIFSATNYDYTKGKLNELVDIIIAEKASLFVSAVGVPPKHIVERLHKAGIPYMNMIGHPKHVQKCLDAGVDIICAQGGEGGGHTGEVPTSILIPQVVDLCKGKKSPLTGRDVTVVAAGAMYRGSSLAAALMMGAQGIWVGTRFILADEAGAPKAHQEAVRTASYEDTVRTIIFTVRFPPSIIIPSPKFSHDAYCLSLHRVVRSVSARTPTSKTGKRTAVTTSRSSHPRELSLPNTTLRN